MLLNSGLHCGEAARMLVELEAREAAAHENHSTGAIVSAASWRKALRGAAAYALVSCNGLQHHAVRVVQQAGRGLLREAVQLHGSEHRGDDGK